MRNMISLTWREGALILTSRLVWLGEESFGDSVLLLLRELSSVTFRGNHSGFKVMAHQVQVVTARLDEKIGRGV